MIKFHRNKCTGPLDLLQKRFSIARMSSSVLVDLYYIQLKNGLYMATDTKGLGSQSFKNLLLPV